MLEVIFKFHDSFVSHEINSLYISKEVKQITIPFY